MPDITEYLTLKQASERTGISHDSLRQAIRREQLTATRHGYTWFVRPEDLAEYAGEYSPQPRRKEEPAE